MSSSRPTLASLAQAVAALAIVVAAVLALKSTHRDVGGAVFALGFLVIAGAVAGRAASWAGLPKLTGYLLAGVAAGPHGAELLATNDVKSLTLINALALALIALQAGAELTIDTLRRTWRSVLLSATFQALLVLPLAAVAFVALRGLLPFAQGLPMSAAWALGLIWAVLCLTRSPGVTLAILNDTKARGPLSEHVLGVVVLLDVIVLVCFAVAMAVASGQLADQPFSIEVLSTLGHELFASVCAGTSFGLLLAVILRAVRRERALMIVVLGYGVTALSSYLAYDTLLVFVVAGFVVANLTHLGHDLVHTSERVSAGVMIVFFATTGARLDVGALLLLWPAALLLFGARLLSTWIGCRVGHRLAGDAPVVRRYAFTAFMSQAGVGIGLATLVGDSLPGVGRDIATLAIAVVALNEMVGPVAFSSALRRAGEIPPPAPPSTPG